jgi:hypothetical protein
MAAAKRTHFEIIDVTDTSRWERFNQLQDETRGVKLEKPSLTKTPGAKISGRLVSHATLKGQKGSMEKYAFMVTGVFKEADNDETVADFVNAEQIKVNKLHKHKMDETERINWELVNKKKLGKREFTELKVTGKVTIQRYQIVEFTSFKEIYANGSKLRPKQYISLTNFRWEEAFGGDRDFTGFKNDSAIEFEPTAFERVEILSFIAHAWGDYQCLWHTRETLKLPYPKEIDDDMKDTGIDKAGELNALKRLKRSYQATESQKNFFFTAVCMPIRPSSEDSPIANRSGKMFTDMTIDIETGGAITDKGGIWATVRGDRFLLQPTFDGEEKVGIHIEFGRQAIDSIGIKNGLVKKAMVPMMLGAMETGKMWCEVDYLASTETTTIPKNDEKSLASYPLYFNCLEIEFDRVAMLRSIAVLITPAFAKMIHGTKIQQDIRDAFTLNHPLSHGDEVYNATEFQAPLDIEDYDYMFSHPKLSVADVARLKKIASTRGWTTEQFADEISKYFGGRAGAQGDAMFAEACSKPEFANETPAIIWGVHKKLREYEPAGSVEMETKILKMYQDWMVKGIEPQLLLPPTQVKEDEGKSEASEVEGEKKKKKSHSSKRAKKDVPKLDD